MSQSLLSDYIFFILFCIIIEAVNSLSYMDVVQAQWPTQRLARWLWYNSDTSFPALKTQCYKIML